MRYFAVITKILCFVKYLARQNTHDMKLSGKNEGFKTANVMMSLLVNVSHTHGERDRERETTVN